jgi:hypothetical protein
MQKTTLISIIFLLLISQITHVFANSQNVSNEIERIEIGENSKTIYYKDGSREMFVTAIVNFGFSVKTTPIIEVHPPLFPIPIDKIFRIIRQILENIFNASGVGCFLLAWKIWNLIKGLRRGRPRDYRGVEWHNL